MDAPAAVRVEELGGATGYRDVADERRRVLHVRGSSPGGVYVLALVCASLTGCFGVAITVWPERADLLGALTIASSCLLPVLLPVIVWRRSQWTMFELERRGVTTTTGPLRAREMVPAWGARAPTIEVRPGTFDEWFGGMRAWSLYAEREDGRRVLLATLYDERSATWVQQQLVEAYRDAQPSSQRDGFAVRFGPLPEGVRCEGDPDDPHGRWRVTLACSRTGLLAELAVSVGALLLSPLLVAMPVAVIAGLVLIERNRELITLAILTLPLGFLLVLTVGLFRVIRHQLRVTTLRWLGRVHIDVHPAGVDIDTTPWRVPLGSPFPRRDGSLQLGIEPLAYDAREARLRLTCGTRSMVFPSPVKTADARYVAKILHAYEISRPA